MKTTAAPQGGNLEVGTADATACGSRPRIHSGGLLDALVERRIIEG